VTNFAITAMADSGSLHAQLGRNRSRSYDYAAVAHVASRASLLHLNLPIYPGHLSVDRTGLRRLNPHNRLNSRPAASFNPA
jgi:hypothetical protein